MTKYEWERQLKKGISGLPVGEQQRVIDYYNELFADKIDAHMREQDIITEFGNPYDVANKILVDYFSDGKAENADEYIFSDTDKMDQAFEEQKPTENVYRSERADDRKERAERKEFEVKTAPIKNTEKPRENNAKHDTAVKSVGGLISIIGVLTFFILGAFFNLWHPAWMVFLLIPLVISIVDAVDRKSWKRFNYPVLVTFMYLSAGFVFGMWHPMWILFVTIPIYYIAGNKISKEKGEYDERKAYEEEKEKQQKQNEKTNGKEIKDTTAVKDSGRLSAGRIIGGIFLSILLVYVAIVVWSIVIGMFVAGIGMLTCGIAAIVVAVAKISADLAVGMLILGGALVVTGMGMIFTFGFAGLFKHCARMCRSFGKTMRKIFKRNKEVTA